MKRNFKLKALVLVMVVMMGLALVPSLYAVGAYQNKPGRTPDNVDVVMSYTAKTASGKPVSSLQPGDEFYIEINVDKLPDNGKGICTISNRFAYDSTVVTPVLAALADDEETGDQILDRNGENPTCVYIELGYFAKRLKLGLTAPENVGITGEPANIKQISFNCSDPKGNAVKPGLFTKVYFKVVDNPSGKDAKMKLLPEEAPYAGIDIRGLVEKVPGSNDWYTAENTTFYVNSNLADVQVPVKCTDIAFEGIASVELDITKKPSEDVTKKVKLTPANATEEMVWTSSNEAVATVSNGVIRAVGNGNATITVTCGEHSATLPVSVTTSVGTASFKKDRYPVDINTTKDLSGEVVIGPAGATAKSITYTSSNTEVVTVDNNGVVTAKKFGTADITVTIDGVSATTTVSVVVPLETISVDKATAEVWKGEQVEFVVTPGPEGAEMESLKATPRSGAEFSTAEVVDNKVIVTGNAKGDTVYNIFANGSTTPELNKQVTVSVKENKITGAVIENDAGAEILRGETLEMVGKYTTEQDEETVHPTTDDNTMTWSISDENVATIDPETGVVTAVKEGTATVTLTVAGKTATYEVKVKEIHVDGVVVEEKVLEELKGIKELTVGDMVVVPFTVTPEGTITDTIEEILEFISAEYDKDLIDVAVKFDKKTGEGTVTLTVKKAGDVKVTVFAGDPEAEDAKVFEVAFKTVEPVVEDTETGDMPVMMLVALMVACGAGIVASKKILVK